MMSNGPARLVTSRVIRSSVRGVDKNTSITLRIGPPRLRDPSAFRTGIGASNGDVVIEDDVTKSLSTKQLVAPQSTRTRARTLLAVSVVVSQLSKVRASSVLMENIDSPSMRMTSVGVENETDK